MLAATPLDDVGVTQHVAFALQLAVGAVFVMSAVPKIRDPGSFSRTVARYGVVGPRASKPVAMVLIVLETLLAVAMLTGALIDVMLPIGAALVLLFLAVTAANLRRGRRIPCGCFGDAAEQISTRTLARLAVLFAVCAALALGFATEWVSATTAASLASHGSGSLGYVLNVSGIAAALLLAAWWAYHLAELKPVLAALRPAQRWRESPSTHAESRT